MSTANATLLQEPPASYTAVAPPDAAITGRIHLIRGQKVMLDRDLAELYGVETKHLKRQVRRNINRFPEDFMFELTAAEWAALRCQFGTSNEQILSERGGSRVLPMAFTEQGVAMLSSVLNSEQAILVNIHIIRVFSRMREVLLSHREVLQKLEQLEGRLSGHDEEIQAIFDHLTELVSPAADQQRKPIGFKPTEA
ncbi:MAG: ORF6N domain-containing protein [Flavobacteriales bacterium]|nr:ORF6N domain-containing protein [Flavobacteriales bacterium]